MVPTRLLSAALPDAVLLVHAFVASRAARFYLPISFFINSTIAAVFVMSLLDRSSQLPAPF
jgi:hypothetical protein